MKVFFLLNFCALALGKTSKPHAGKIPAKVSAMHASRAPVAQKDSCIVASYDQGGSMANCKSVIIKGQTVPAGKGLVLNGLADGTTVTLQGTLTFAPGNYRDGTLFTLRGGKIVFDGQGNTIDGSGKSYWDERGTNGGDKSKPHFALSLQHSGVFKNVIVKNTPTHGFQVLNRAPLIISGVTHDNSAASVIGPYGKAIGHNTDGFDISQSVDLTITGCTVINQDDCIALKSGTNTVISNNVCKNGHGISIGSVATGSVVDGVVISNNQVIDSENGLRIKTYYGASKASVKNVVYRDNRVTGCTRFGVIIVQDYTNEREIGKVTSGVPIENVSFLGHNSVSLGPRAVGVKVLCAPGDCVGRWDWSGLKVSGTTLSDVDVGDAPITGYTLSVPGGAHR